MMVEHSSTQALTLIVSVLLVTFTLHVSRLTTTAMAQETVDAIPLPAPDLDGEMSAEAAMHQRRSVRDFATSSLELGTVSQLLWAAQGITSPDGYRTVPSAGALYPLEIFLVAGDVEGLTPGVYRYAPQQHGLIAGVTGDRRRQLAEAALRQSWIRRAPAIIVITGVMERTAIKYGERALRYVQIEAGSAAQNVYLQATATGLATVLVGAFDDTRVQEALGLPANHAPFSLMPVARPR